MGLFSFLKDAAIEANEDAHGARLLSTVQSIFVEMEGLDPKPQFVTMAGYLQIRERLQNVIGDYSKEEKIKMGRIMQDQAREQFQFDMTGGYAKLLAGAWLESQERDSMKAEQAYALLNAFADHVRQTIDELRSA
jgi:hypothetical protein